MIFSSRIKNLGQLTVLTLVLSLGMNANAAALSCKSLLYTKKILIANQIDELKPTAAQLLFRQKSIQIVKRIEGKTNAEIKSIQIPEFKEFATDVHIHLKENLGLLQPSSWYLRFRFNKAIWATEKMIRQNDFRYFNVISLALEATKLFNAKVYDVESSLLNQDSAQASWRPRSDQFMSQTLTEYFKNWHIRAGEAIMIPTMKNLHFSDFTIIADQNLNYLGIVTDRTTYDGRVNETPQDYLRHDLLHAFNSKVKSFEERQRVNSFIKIIYDNSTQLSVNEKINVMVLLFELSHELPIVLTAENVRLTLDRLGHLSNTIAQRATQNDFGADKKIAAALKDKAARDAAFEYVRSVAQRL